MFKSKIIPLLFCLVTIPLSIHALELPNVFSDHMVLQQNQAVPVWGKGQPGERVSVQFAGQKVDTMVQENGSWSLSLAPLRASFEPQVLVVRAGEEEKLFQDILVGEVWLCSGQSNMHWRVALAKDSDLEILAARYPAIRMYDVSRTVAAEPRFSDEAVWEVCSPATIASFSAVGYYFGRDLRQVLNVPIGLIEASWGGTPSIAWTRKSAIHKHPLLIEQVEWWEEQSRLDPENSPKNPHHGPASLANGMLATVAPFAVAGSIWYQGEHEAQRQLRHYDERLRIMIEDWREWWNLPDMPFGIVQLAAFMKPDTEPANTSWPLLREDQRRLSRDLQHTGLAVTIDIGEADTIHPKNKQEVGRRLARWALADVYNELDLRGGPELEKGSFSGGAVHLQFSSTGSGLKVIDGFQLQGFSLAGTDGVFHEAQAQIEGPDRILVTSDEVPEPVHLRYAWNNNPVDANLGNEERLPASPFQIMKFHSPAHSGGDILENHVEAGDEN